MTLWRTWRVLPCAEFFRAQEPLIDRVILLDHSPQARLPHRLDGGTKRIAFGLGGSQPLRQRVTWINRLGAAGAAVAASRYVTAAPSRWDRTGKLLAGATIGPANPGH